MPMGLLISISTITIDALLSISITFISVNK